MEKVSFTYQGRHYTAELIKSEQLSPQYYWLVFDDNELEEKFGDIAFKIKADNLEPVYEIISERYNDLFESMRLAIKNILLRK